MSGWRAAHSTKTCVDPDCDYCEHRAEERADPEAGATDWQAGQDQYERFLDAMGPQT